MKNDRIKRKLFTRRALIVSALKASMLGVLASRLGYLQLISGSKYKSLAENNSIKIVIIRPLRSMLFDRNGVVIVENKFTYNLVLDNKHLNNIEEIVAYVERIFGYQSDISNIGIKKVLRSTAKGQHIVIQENLSWTEIAKIEVRTDLYGVDIIQTEKRYYIYQEITAHITGYVAKPNQVEVDASTIPHYRDFLIGKTGVEKSLNETLLGTPGARKVEVNATGRFMREILYMPPTRGPDVNLSIDMKLQKITAAHLSEFNGSAVILNAKTGEVMAMHSNPSYDPNQFIGVLQPKYWDKIKSDASRPLINKAIYSIYPPGSIFKMVVALAILQAGIDPKKKIHCRGEHSIGNRVFRCWKKDGHGFVDLNSAIAGSCNVYFYIQGLLAGMDNILDISYKLGFANKTGIELPFESSGLMPNKEWIGRKLNGVWSGGDTVNMTIGQGYALVTPIQLAKASACIATGLSITPSILLRDASRQMEYPKINIPKEHLDIVRSGLYDVFNSIRGTAYYKRIQDDRLVLSGKTGTAQVATQKQRNQVLEYKLRDHGLFSGYFSFDEEIYSIAVVTENSGWGSISALPIAIKIIKEYFLAEPS